MANIPIYDGNPSFLQGMTPFGFYDADADFQDVIEIDPDGLDDVCDDILNWLVGVKLCKLCGKDELDCFWDNKNDEMRFMFKDGKEFDWTKC